MKGPRLHAVAIADLAWQRFGVQYTLAGFMCCCTGRSGTCRSGAAAAELDDAAVSRWKDETCLS
jgi:hypothetical protein